LKNPEIATVLPVSRQRSKIAQAKADHLAEEFADGRVAIPIGSRLFEPNQTSVQNQQDESNRIRWTGVPTDPFNATAVIDEGTLLGRIGHSRSRVISVYVPDRRIDSVRIGQHVAVTPGSFETDKIHGTVTQIASDPVSELPPEMVASGWIRIDTRANETRKPEITHYEVTVTIEASDVLPTRWVVPVRIRTETESLWTRFITSIRSTLTLSI
jgi:hypothetical protein